MKLLKSYPITGGAISPDADWVGGGGAPDAAQLLTLPHRSRGVEFVALLVNGAGVPVGAVGTFSYDVVEQVVGAGQTRFALIATGTTQNVGTLVRDAPNGDQRNERSVAIRIYTAASLPAGGSLEVWARPV